MECLVYASDAEVEISGWSMSKKNNLLLSSSIIYVYIKQYILTMI